ncbi:MAG: TerB family tellurite resistance protein [Pseudomonadota bacterium]
MSVWERISNRLSKATSTGSIGGFLRDIIGASPGREGDPTNEVAFTMGVIALCAKMAKADGIVVAAEVEAFKDVFKVPPGEAANVARVFDLAKQDVAGFEAYAQQVAHLLGDDKHLLQDVLEGLFHIAAADGVLHPAEEEYLQAVSRRFGFSDSEFRTIRALFVQDTEGPYEVLGIAADASDDEVRARHRRLVLENHPDRLIARGVPAEFVEVANRKMAAINEAFDTITKERGL